MDANRHEGKVQLPGAFQAPPGPPIRPHANTPTRRYLPVATYGLTILAGSTTRSNSSCVTKPSFIAASFSERSLSIAFAVHIYFIGLAAPDRAGARPYQRSIGSAPSREVERETRGKAATRRNDEFDHRYELIQRPAPSVAGPVLSHRSGALVANSSARYCSASVRSNWWIT